MKIVLIGGKARSGKDTLTDYLINELSELGKRPCRVQISQYIKYYAIKYFGWDGSEDTKPRDFLNEIGTEIIRNKIDPDFHIKRLIDDIRILSYYYDTFIVSDIRFADEIEKISDYFDDTISVKIFRDNDLLTDEQKNHVSENGLDSYNLFDFVIDNNGTLDDLYKNADNLITKVVK